MTHAVKGTVDWKTESGDKAYGEENTQILAGENPRKARNNADNYAYFAVAAYFEAKDGTQWSTARDDEL